MATQKQIKFFNILKKQGRPSLVDTIDNESVPEAWKIIGDMLGREGRGDAYQNDDTNNEIVNEYKANKDLKANYMNPNTFNNEETLNDLKDDLNSQLEGINIESIDYYRAKNTNSQYLDIDTADGKYQVALGNHYIDGGVKELNEGDIQYDQKIGGMDGEDRTTIKLGLAKNGQVDMNRLTDMIQQKHNEDFGTNLQIKSRDYNAISKRKAETKELQSDLPTDLKRAINKKGNYYANQLGKMKDFSIDKLSDKKWLQSQDEWTIKNALWQLPKEYQNMATKALDLPEGHNFALKGLKE